MITYITQAPNTLLVYATNFGGHKGDTKQSPSPQEVYNLTGQIELILMAKYE